MQILDPQTPKLARPLSPGEREDSIPKRQRPAEVNTVLAIAGGDSTIEISALTDDQNALRTADKFWVAEVSTDRRNKFSHNTLGIKTETGWVTQNEICGARIQTALLTIAAIHGNPIAFGDCHSTHHQSPMPSESEPVYVEAAPEAQLDYSKVWLYKKDFQGLKIFLQAWCIHSTQKINDVSYNQLISDPSTYVKIRAQRSDDSILWLTWMTWWARDQMNIA